MKELVCLSVMTIVLHFLHHTFFGDAFKDCMSKAGEIRVHLEPLFSRDCDAGASAPKNTLYFTESLI